MSLSLQQIEEALRLVGWSVDDLARHARVGALDFDAWKNGRTAPPERTLETLKSAFEAAGVAFGADGVQLGGEANDAQSISVDQMNSANDK